MAGNPCRPLRLCRRDSESVVVESQSTSTDALLCEVPRPSAAIVVVEAEVAQGGVSVYSGRYCAYSYRGFCYSAGSATPVSGGATWGLGSVPLAPCRDAAGCRLLAVIGLSTSYPGYSAPGAVDGNIALVAQSASIGFSGTSCFAVSTALVVDYGYPLGPTRLYLSASAVSRLRSSASFWFHRRR